jgi:hypothetical protein
MDPELLKQDRTGWYIRNQWPQHLAQRNLKYLSHASRLPDKDEHVLVALMNVSRLVQKRSLEGLMTLDLELRRWLKSPLRSEAEVRPLSRLQNVESEDRYFRYMRRFLFYIFRVFASEMDLTESGEAEPGEGEREGRQSQH